MRNVGNTSQMAEVQQIRTVANCGTEKQNATQRMGKKETESIAPLWSMTPVKTWNETESEGKGVV